MRDTSELDQPVADEGHAFTSAGKASSAARPSGVRQVWSPTSTVLRVRAVVLLLLLDITLVLGAFSATALAKQLATGQGGWPVFGLALTGLYVAVAANAQAYASTNLRDPSQAVRRAVKALLIALGALLAVMFYLKSSELFSRLEIAEGSIVAAFALATGRFLFVRHLHAIVGGNPFSAILILDGDQPVPVGEFSAIVAAQAHFDPEEHDPVMYDRLARSLATADRVVIACPAARRVAWARALRGANIQGEIVVPEIAELGPIGLYSRHGTPSVIVANGPLDLSNRCVKRVFDVVLSAVALLFALPLFAIIALLIKLESKGPVLFKQTRIGRGNRHFNLFKFRSMRLESLDTNANKSVTRDDDRVTRVGRIIRKTSLDELPQLIHVFTGEMSIVGPRPHALGSRAANKLFWEVDSRYWHRHAAKPGLTGLAQVRGYRGNTEVEEDLTNRLESDLEYLQSWSIWRDLKIIVLTARVLVHKNAF